MRPSSRPDGWSLHGKHSPRVRFPRILNYPTRTAPPFTLNTSPGDEARLGSTQEQDGAGDLFRLCHSAEWNGFEDDIASPGVVKGVSRHVRVHPAGRNAIDVNTIFRKLGGPVL